MLGDRLARLWERGCPAVMGVINVTPDSFSDGGRVLDLATGLERGAQLLAEGADILDVGGESTRPGAQRIAADVELERVVPVITELIRRFPDVLLSVDTRRASVAAQALAAGARIVNDVSAGADPAMFGVVARAGAGIVLMHMRGEPATMQRNTVYTDVVAEVHEFLLARAAAAETAGIARESVLLDPGIGFGKDVGGNLALLAALADLAAVGYPVVIGASRKSFIGRLTGAVVEDRLPGSLGAIADTPRLGRAVVRVHDVAPTVQFLAVRRALLGAA